MEPESSPRSSSSSPPEYLVESFIGEFVSLISNDDKRYEGVICLLNLQDSTLGLQNVRCYGREGKNNNEQRVVQLLYKVYEHMLFSGSDIKDIQVLSLPAPPKHDFVIGRFISVITTEDVRCEGLITHVNFRHSLIYMKNVECFGTEGRNRRRRSACNQLVGFIQFRFKDIKDLEIIFLKPKKDRKPEEEETAHEPDEYPPLSRSHLGHV